MEKFEWSPEVLSETAERISPYIHRTPVVTSTQADDKCGRKLFFKCENFQKTGSFKVRGALNAVLQCKNRGGSISGLVTHSTGNHGQALSWACREAGLPCHVVVSETVPEVKKTAIKGYGANLVESGADVNECFATCENLQREKNLEYISSHDHIDVIAGQSTVAKEFLEDVPYLDAILTPIAGGGLASGIALAAKAIKPDIKIFLVTPPGKRMEECLRTGKRPWEGPRVNLNTIADGLRFREIGHISTSILTELAEKDVFEVGNEEIISAMRFAFERMKLVIEPSGAASLAAAFSDKLKTMDPKMVNIGVVLSGGNVDIDHLPWSCGH